MQSTQPTSQPATMPEKRLFTEGGPVGRPLIRRDGREKVTGRATYTAEWDVPDALYAVGVQSDIARGMIDRIETAAAKRVSGFDVLTHVTVNEPTGELQTMSGGGGAAGSKVKPLGGPEIFHAGQWVACCLGRTLEQATHAAQLVKISYAQRTPTLSIDEAEVESPARDAGQPNPFTKGDPQAEFDASAVQIDAEYVTPTEHHNPIEPHATIAQWGTNDRGEPTLTVYDSSQYIFGVRDSLADLFKDVGLTSDNVRVICKFIGGAFGCKGNMWPHVPLAAMAARFAKRPVRLVLMREQMYGGIGFRPVTRQRVRLGAEEGGKLNSLMHEGTSATNFKDNFVESVTVASRVMYGAPGLRFHQKIARLDMQSPTFMRAPGETPGMFASESAMDELAVACNLDPIALRKANEPPVDPSNGAPWSGRRVVECYDRAAASFGWQAGPRTPRAMTDGRWLVGHGMAAATYHASYLPNAAKLRANADGTFLVTCGTHEMGTGTTTAQSQVAADLLGVPVRRVSMELGDTRLPFGHVSGGSMTTAGVGGAIKLAVGELKEKLLAVALANGVDGLADRKPEALAFRDGKLIDAATGEGVAIDELVGMTMNDHVEVQATNADIRPPRSTLGGFSNHSFGCHLCEVGVDESLGLVRVRRWNACFACGIILNAKTARSQFIGGIVMGLGQALMEESFRDGRSGKITNHNLAEYHVPTNADVPPMQIEWLDDADYNASPIGAKGIGEIGITGVAAAVANAVYDATGRRVRHLPLVPERVMIPSA